MKIVIELSDETYKDIKEENGIYGINDGLCARITGKVVGAIQSGTPLPEGHGRIGDVDQMEYLKALHDAKFGKIKFSEAINKIKNSIPTIVEADRAESEEEK